MTPSASIYGQLKRFRAGVEAGISYLKRCFGLDRCHWRGWERFQAYVHSAVFTPQPDAADSLTAILTPVSVAASARSSLPYSVGRLLGARGIEQVRAIMGTHQYVKR